MIDKLFNWDPQFDPVGSTVGAELHVRAGAHNRRNAGGATGEKLSVIQHVKVPFAAIKSPRSWPITAPLTVLGRTAYEDICFSLQIKDKMLPRVCASHA